MDPLKKAFRAPAINLKGVVGILAGSELPTEMDDDSVPVGSLYLRTTGAAYLKSAPGVWKKLILEST